MKYTIKQIAQMAGVHRSTVDKVLHGRIGVSDEVRLRVQKIIDDVEYKPDPLGKALKKRQAPIHLAAILLDVSALPFIDHGINRALQAYDSFNVSMERHTVKMSDIETQLALLDRMIEQAVDGIILQPIPSRRLLKAINRAVAAGIHVITCNHDIENSDRLCFVGQNQYRAGRVAARLLGEFLRGQGEIAVITGTENYKDASSAANRETGFFEIMREAFSGIRIVDAVAAYDDDDVIHDKTAEILQSHPQLDGIYISSGGVAACAQAVREAGRGGSVKMVCFETYEEILDLLRQGVVSATISSDLENQGYLPVQMLLELMIYDNMPAHRNSYTNMEILVKESI